MSQVAVIDASKNSALCWNNVHDNFHIQSPNKQKLDPLIYVPPPIDFPRNHVPCSSKRIESLEKALQFLQAHHSEVLSSLHAEVDHLKRYNQELLLKFAILQNSNEFSRAFPLENPSPIARTSNKKCQTPRDDNDDSMKKKIEYLSDQVEKLDEALREEKLKVSAATAELRRLEMKNRRQSEVSDALLSEKRSWERDKNHSKSPIGLTHSLPAISQNQFISTKHMHDYQRNSKKAVEEAAANKDLNILEEDCDPFKRNCLSCRSLSLSDPSTRSITQIPSQLPKKSPATMQMPKINLGFSENSARSATSFDTSVFQTRSQPKFRRINSRKNSNRRGSTSEGDVNNP